MTFQNENKSKSNFKKKNNKFWEKEDKVAKMTSAKETSAAVKNYQSVYEKDQRTP